jgi:hypothetical protein
MTRDNSLLYADLYPPTRLNHGYDIIDLSIHIENASEIMDLNLIYLMKVSHSIIHVETKS